MIESRAEISTLGAYHTATASTHSPVSQVVSSIREGIAEPTLMRGRR